MYNWSGTVPVELLELWTICMYIANWQLIDLFLERRTFLPTSSSVASCRLQWHTISGWKTVHTLGAQSVHTRWILKLKSLSKLLHFMRQVTAVACCFCICFAETRIQILSDDVRSVTKISGELLGVRWASYFSNILRSWVYLFLENNTNCHLWVFGSFVEQNSHQ